MRDKIEMLLNQALQNPKKPVSDEISERLYVKFFCDEKYWGADLSVIGNPASCIMFSAEILKGEIEIESIKVSPFVQRKGIGGLLFSGMLDIVEVMSSMLTAQGYPPIKTICGELRPYDPPYDQYEKSIPFYMKQAKLHNLGIQFYEDNEATFEKKEISFEEALGFIDAWKCGSFRYSLT